MPSLIPTSKLTHHPLPSLQNPPYHLVESVMKKDSCLGNKALPQTRMSLLGGVGQYSWSFLKQKSKISNLSLLVKKEIKSKEELRSP